MNATKAQKTEIILFWASSIALFYFVLLYLNTELFHFDYAILGVVQELFTLPLIIGVFVLLVFVLIKIIRNSYHDIRFILAIAVNSVILLTWIIVSFIK